MGMFRGRCARFGAWSLACWLGLGALTSLAAGESPVARMAPDGAHAGAGVAPSTYADTTAVQPVPARLRAPASARPATPPAGGHVAEETAPLVSPTQGATRPTRAAREDDVPAETTAAPFNNACSPPDRGGVDVPKTAAALRAQLGDTFRVVQRGNFLIASDLEGLEFDRLVNGVFPCCKHCLESDFFARRSTDTVTVYVFKDTDSYQAGLRRNFRMEPISPYGHYGHSQRYIVVNASTGPGTLVHETTHALMAPDFPAAPIWISEGVASLYEQCRVEGNSLRGDQNWRLPELQRALAAGKVTPLRILFAYNARGFRRMDESLHYAEARYFCKFMEHRGVLRKLYRLFRDNADRDPTGVRCVEQVFGKPLAEIEAEWHDWVREQTWAK